MTGACTIDGIDIATLGVLILRGGDHDFISFPSRKDPKYNDWPEEDGIEISDDDPVFNEKKVTAKYYLKGDETNFKSRVNSFIDLHMQAGYRSVYVREFDKTFQLRFSGITGYSQRRGFSTSGEKAAYINVSYVMDDPLQFLYPAITEPASGRQIKTLVTVNNTDLSDYGIVVREVYPTAMKQTAKEGLIINSDYQTGLIADVDYSPKKEKQNVTIKCTMIADSRAAFWTNYNALWNNISGKVIILGLPAPMRDFRCWYSGMSDFEKRPWTGRVFMTFNLNLVAYADEIPYLLSTENGELVVTGTDEYFIDMYY